MGPGTPPFPTRALIQPLICAVSCQKQDISLLRHLQVLQDYLRRLRAGTSDLLRAPIHRPPSNSLPTASIHADRRNSCASRSYDLVRGDLARLPAKRGTYRLHRRFGTPSHSHRPLSPNECANDLENGISAPLFAKSDVITHQIPDPSSESCLRTPPTPPDTSSRAHRSTTLATQYIPVRYTRPASPSPAAHLRPHIQDRPAVSNCMRRPAITVSQLCDLLTKSMKLTVLVHTSVNISTWGRGAAHADASMAGSTRGGLCRYAPRVARHRPPGADDYVAVRAH